jgi:hypothetical protein
VLFRNLLILFSRVQEKPVIFYLFVIYSLVEIIRYPYYMFRVYDLNVGLLTWCEIFPFSWSQSYDF